MNKLTKWYNKYIRYRKYNKESQLSLENKIEFLKYYNLESNFEKDGKVLMSYIYDRTGFYAMLGKFLFRKQLIKQLRYCSIKDYFIELALYKPIKQSYGFWFPITEKGWEKRKAICNELLGELEEKQRKIKRKEL